MASKIRSEDELGKKWDRCLSDTGIKLGIPLNYCNLFENCICLYNRSVI